jgi:hypothetical protein
MADSINLAPERSAQTFSIVMASGGTQSAAIDTRGYRGGMVYLPAEFNSETISIIVSDTATGTFGLPLSDGDTAAYTFSAPSAPAWHILPQQLMESAAFIKIQTGTAAAGAATINGVLKAF